MPDVSVDLLEPSRPITHVFTRSRMTIQPVDAAVVIEQSVDVHVIDLIAAEFERIEKERAKKLRVNE